jgi:CDP-diacylglycerol---serine O-phosphatidyltransferase
LSKRQKVKKVVPSLATVTSLMLGAIAIMVLLEGKFWLAAVFITLGSILDVLDGELAVRLDAISHLGKELDSLADMVTFGVAPTIMLYRLMTEVGVALPVAMSSSLVFVLAGAYRLARYNTLPSDRRAYFKGMPIPLACLLLVSGSFWQHWQVHLWWPLAVVVVSVLMISVFPYAKNIHVLRMPLPLIAALAVLVIGWGLVAGGWPAVPFGFFALYACSGPARWLYLRWKHPHLIKEEEHVERNAAGPA